MPSLALRSCVVVALCATIALSAARIGPYASLAARLWGEPMAERGQLGADERHNPLGLSGHLTLRRALSRAPLDARPSLAARTWRWAYELQALVPADARVFVNAPNPAVYFYLSFFLHPVPVEIDRDAERVLGRAQEIRVVPDAQLGALLQRGYTHIITRSAAGQLGVLTGAKRQ